MLPRLLAAQDGGERFLPQFFIFEDCKALGSAQLVKLKPVGLCARRRAQKWKYSHPRGGHGSGGALGAPWQVPEPRCPQRRRVPDGDIEK